jgi:sulfur carrier protein
MQLIINGESRELDEGISIAQMLEQSDLAAKRIAVEVNEQIIPKGRHAQTLLHDGDKIEIIHAIGGG